MMKFEIPPQVVEIIELLHAHTYEAYLVGDCIRAMLQKEIPRDFDIVTNAEPERITAIFEERYRTTAGRTSGELIIINAAMGISVSSFHSTDINGKPVYGAKDATLRDDLRRRVYTADAIAYDLDKGMFDPLEGAACITDSKVLLRAVGESEAEAFEREHLERHDRRTDKKAFTKATIPVLNENPTAALEAIRRFSRGGISISAYTLKALFANRRELIDAVPRDWLLDALHDIIMGKRITDTLLTFRPFLFTLIPKLNEIDGYAQRSAFQEFTLFEHIAKAVGYAVPDYTVRLALLLHGVGKRDCEADRGTYNSYDGHDERGAMLARDILNEFSVPENIVKEVVFLILHHDDPIDEQNYTTYTAEYGVNSVKNLLLLQSANTRAKSPDREHEQRAAELRALADSIGKPQTGNTGRSITSADLKRVLSGK